MRTLVIDLDFSSDALGRSQVQGEEWASLRLPPLMHTCEVRRVLFSTSIWSSFSHALSPCEACPLGRDQCIVDHRASWRSQSFIIRACGQPIQTSILSGIVGARNGGRIFHRDPQLPSLSSISAFRDRHLSPRVCGLCLELLV